MPKYLVRFAITFWIKSNFAIFQGQFSYTVSFSSYVALKMYKNDKKVTVSMTETKKKFWKFGVKQRKKGSCFIYPMTIIIYSVTW